MPLTHDGQLDIVSAMQIHQVLWSNQFSLCIAISLSSLHLSSFTVELLWENLIKYLPATKVRLTGLVDSSQGSLPWYLKHDACFTAVNLSGLLLSTRAPCSMCTITLCLILAQWLCSDFSASIIEGKVICRAIKYSHSVELLRVFIQIS